MSLAVSLFQHRVLLLSEQYRSSERPTSSQIRISSFYSFGNNNNPQEITLKICNNITEDQFWCRRKKANSFPSVLEKHQFLIYHFTYLFESTSLLEHKNYKLCKCIQLQFANIWRPFWMDFRIFSNGCCCETHYNIYLTSTLLHTWTNERGMNLFASIRQLERINLLQISLITRLFTTTPAGFPIS